MTSNVQLTFSQRHRDYQRAAAEHTGALGPMVYTVLYNGSPLMASTEDKARALRVLRDCFNKNKLLGNSPTVSHWDGDTATETRGGAVRELLADLGYVVLA